MLTLMLLIISLVYIGFVSIIYFRQKHIETVELKIFNKLIIANIIGLIIEISAKIATINLTTSHILTLIICRLYLIYLVWFAIFMTGYVYSVSVNSNNEEDKRNKNIVIANFNIN